MPLCSAAARQVTRLARPVPSLPHSCCLQSASQCTLNSFTHWSAPEFFSYGLIQGSSFARSHLELTKHTQVRFAPTPPLPSPAWKWQFIAVSCRLVSLPTQDFWAATPLTPLHVCKRLSPISYQETLSPPAATCHSVCFEIKNL